MEALDALQYGGGAGSLLLGLGLVFRAVGAFLERLPAVIEKIADSWRRVREKQASASDTAMRTIKGIVEDVAKMRNELGECEEARREMAEQHAVARKVAEDAIQASREMQAAFESLSEWCEALVKKLESRGISVPAMPAVARRK